MSCIIDNYKDWSKKQLDKGANKLQLDYVWLDTLRAKREPAVVNILDKLVSANRGSMEFAVAYNNTNKTVGSRLVDIELNNGMIDVYMENGKYTFKPGEVKSQPLKDSKVKYLYMPAMEITGAKYLNSEPNEEVRKGQLEVAREKINDRVSIEKLKEKLNKLDKIGTSEKHQKRLDKVLDILVSPVLKAIPDMEIYLDEKAKANGGAIIIDKGQERIELSVGTQERLYGTDMSAVEKMTHELGHGATHWAMNYRKEEIGKEINQLKRLRQAVMGKITPEDLLGEVVINREVELEIAKARIEYMTQDKDGRNSLEEFVMYALTNEPMIKFMENITLAKDDKGKDWFEKLLNIMRNIMEKMMGVFGRESRRTMAGDQLVMKLVGDIAAVNNKIDRELNVLEKASEAINNLDDKFAEYMEEWADKAEEKVLKEVWPKLDRKEKLTMLEKMRILHFTLTNTNGQPILEGLLKSIGLKPTGTIQTIIRHLRHADEYGNKMQELTMASGMIDSQRQNTSSSINEMIAQTFKSKLNKNEKKALYGAMYIADVGSLVELDNFRELMRDGSKLDKEISKLEGKIRKISVNEGQRRMLEFQAKGLADLMRTGKGSIIQRRNAQAIAQYVNNSNEELVETLDKLVSMYAVRDLDESVKEAFNTLLDKDEEAVVSLGKTMVATREYIKSKQNTQQNINMMKNYHREAYDEYVTSKVASIREEKEMNAKGYKWVADLPSTGLGLDGDPLALYVSTDMIRQPFNRSSMRYVGDKQSGLLLFETALKAGHSEKIGQIVQKQKEKGMDIEEITAKAVMEGKELPKRETNVIPELDENGYTIDYRTFVTMENKMKYLGLDTNPMEVVGRTWGHEVDVEESEQHVRVVWEELMKDAAENAIPGEVLGHNKYSYIAIDPTSDDFHARDVARILPPYIKKKLNKIRELEKIIASGNETKIAQKIRAKELTGGTENPQISDAVYRDVVTPMVWDKLNDKVKTRMKKSLKNGTFMVRENMILDAFGARDMSLADWKRLPKQLKTVIKKIENAWKEIVKIFKVDIVIRLLPVIMGNIISNLMYSVQTGHMPWEVAKLQLEAVEELKLYIKNKKEISQLMAKLVTDPNNEKIRNRIEMLRSDIRNSPIYPLIKAGMYQHIVEDVGLDDFKSNSRFANWIDDKTESWPEFARMGLHWMYVSEKTSLFQMVTKATAYSDFAARYAQHTLMKRRQINKFKEKKGRAPNTEELKKIDKELAVTIRDAFVNYSQPDSRFMQYLNDIGFIMFTKYMVRIQKVIQDGVAKHPLRFALALIGQESLDATIGWEPDDIAEKTMYGRSIDDMFYMPGFTGVIKGVTDFQMYTYFKELKSALESVE